MSNARPQGMPTLTPETPTDCSYSQTQKHTQAGIFQNHIRWTSRANFHEQNKNLVISFLSVPAQGRTALKAVYLKDIRLCEVLFAWIFISFC